MLGVVNHKRKIKGGVSNLGETGRDIFRCSDAHKHLFIVLYYCIIIDLDNDFNNNGFIKWLFKC